MVTHALLSLFVLLASAGAARADTSAPVGSPAAARTRSSEGAPAASAEPSEGHVIEVTFGSAQLFNYQSVVTTSGRVEEQVIPVSSALLMFEWLFHERWSLLSLFNLPLETQRTVVDGQARDEFVAPSLALGTRVSALRLEVFAASRLELQLAALAGLTIGSNAGDQVFPLVAGRLHFANRAGFALYLGGAYAFQRETVALLYGIGHRF